MIMIKVAPRCSRKGQCCESAGCACGVIGMSTLSYLSPYPRSTAEGLYIYPSDKFKRQDNKLLKDNMGDCLHELELEKYL